MGVSWPLKRHYSVGFCRSLNFIVTYHTCRLKREERWWHCDRTLSAVRSLILNYKDRVIGHSEAHKLTFVQSNWKPINQAGWRAKATQHRLHAHGAYRRGNGFSVGGAKIGEKQDNQIQSITLCNIYFFRKRYTQCTLGYGAKPGMGQSPISWGIYENFCV